MDPIKTPPVTITCDNHLLVGVVGSHMAVAATLRDASEDEEDLYGDGANWWVIVQDNELFRFKEQTDALRFFAFAVGQALAEELMEATGRLADLPQTPVVWHNGHKPTEFLIPTTY